MITTQDRSDNELRAEAERLEARAQDLEDQAEDLRDEAATLESEACELDDNAEALRAEIERREAERVRAKGDASLRPGFGDHWPALFPESHSVATNPRPPVAMYINGAQWVTNGHVLVRPRAHVDVDEAPEGWRSAMVRYVELMASAQHVGTIMVPGDAPGERTTKINGTTYASRYVDLLTHLADAPLRVVAHEQAGVELRMLVAFRGGAPAGFAMPMKTWEDWQ